jgi:SAM-dependent methyltransferase
VLREDHGVWLAMSDERIAYYAEFIRNYAHIRAAEGRGNTDPDFYLNLPYRDTSGINRGQWAIRARTFDYLTQNLLKAPAKPDITRILDIGAGNGWMSFRLALAGYAPVAVDLLTNHDDGLGAAEHYRFFLPKLFPRFQAESEHLPFADDEFDAAIFNASFHYSEDYSASLKETLRCVRIGGSVIICDTPWYLHEESGQQMVAERKAYYRRKYGTASDSLHSLEYLTDERLRLLERELSIRWNILEPWYGFKWALRPLLAKLRGRRTPSKFRIYVAQKNA